jgi:osmotically-inducible protein OsmY
VRQLLALVIVIVLVVAAWYYLRRRPADLSSGRAALDEVGEKLGGVGDRLQAAKSAGEVKAAFELDRELAAYDIDVDAGPQEGVVILRGDVPREEARAAAERVAAAVPSVQQVVNELRVDPALPTPASGDRTLGESLDDRALEAKVNLAFSLNRELKGTDIKVQAYRKQVTLRGEVSTPAQKALAAQVASRTPAVAAVTDEITVQGQPVATPPGAVPSPVGSPGGTTITPSPMPRPSPAATRRPSGAPASTL